MHWPANTFKILLFLYRHYISLWLSQISLNTLTYCLEFCGVIITERFVEVIIQSDVRLLADFISRFTVWNTFNHPTLQPRVNMCTQFVEKSKFTDYGVVTQITSVCMNQADSPLELWPPPCMASGTALTRSAQICSWRERSPAEPACPKHKKGNEYGSIHVWWMLYMNQNN